MGIMTRLIRICKADVHGVMDQLEDKGLLLKQHLRDMQETLTARETELKKLTASRNRICQDRQKYKSHCEKLEQDLTVAIQKDKDDIARMLIRKIKPLESLQNDLSRHLNDLDRQISAYSESLDLQKIQYEQLRHRASGYLQKSESQAWEPSLASILPDFITGELAEEEVELELMQRKATIGGLQS